MYVFVICVFSCLHVFVFSICGMCVCCFSVFLLYVVGVLCSVSFTINVIISVLLCVFFFSFFRSCDVRFLYFFVEGGGRHGTSARIFCFVTPAVVLLTADPIVGTPGQQFGPGPFGAQIGIQRKHALIMN